MILYIYILREKLLKKENVSLLLSLSFFFLVYVKRKQFFNSNVDLIARPFAG